jgi:hypothetical protein
MCLHYVLADRVCSAEFRVSIGSRRMGSSWLFRAGLDTNGFRRHYIVCRMGCQCNGFIILVNVLRGSEWVSEWLL